MLSIFNGSRPHSFVTADFNDDGKMDVGIFQGYGNISFASEMILSTGPNSSPYSIAAADFNNDTMLDIILTNYNTNNIDILLGYGNGTFGDVLLISIGYGSHPFSVVVGDFNNDRKLDFAVANDGTDSLDLFLQTC